MAESAAGRLPPDAGSGRVSRPLALGRVLRVALGSAEWLLLCGWVGGWALFAFVVAPTAFRVLPSSQVAGTLVSPVLTVLHLYGAAAGVALAALAWGRGRGRLLSWLPLALAALCLYSQFGVSAEIAEVRGLAFGPEGNEVAAARFAHLHRVSVTIFFGVWMGAAALVVLLVDSEERSRSASDGVS